MDQGLKGLEFISQLRKLLKGLRWESGRISFEFSEHHSRELIGVWGTQGE